MGTHKDQKMVEMQRSFRAPSPLAVIVGLLVTWLVYSANSSHTAIHVKVKSNSDCKVIFWLLSCRIFWYFILRRFLSNYII
jgi:hypothetical protein